MTRRFRLVDSGVRDGRLQIAYDAALTELHERGRVPDTVRFMRFPPTVLVGRHQVLADEVHVERCRAEGVGLVRRVSGGGAIYLDEGQVGWELVFARSTFPAGSLGDHARMICEAVALGLSKRFAMTARFRPRNDIEVDGRKLCGTGGYFAGDTLVYQGTVLVDMDAARMARLLNIPAAKLERHGTQGAASRVVTLKELLGAAPPIADVHAAVLEGLAAGLGIEAEPGTMTPDEEALTRKLHDAEIGTDAFVFGETLSRGEGVLVSEHRAPGGAVKAHLRLEGSGDARRVREALITGDFFIAPPRAVLDLEAHLRGVPVSNIASEVDRFFARAGIAMLSLSPADFTAALEAAATAGSGPAGATTDDQPHLTDTGHSQGRPST